MSPNLRIKWTNGLGPHTDNGIANIHSMLNRLVSSPLVVTVFVMESYKSLQPDPIDTIINLLLQIANGPNNTSPSPLSKTLFSLFAQTPSSVRINVFWFVSLILSLTTVLVGTTALQWLREHQSYHGFSPKETLAILHMRSEALDAWYVPQIFPHCPCFCTVQSALEWNSQSPSPVSLDWPSYSLLLPRLFPHSNLCSCYLGTFHAVRFQLHVHSDLHNH